MGTFANGLISFNKTSGKTLQFKRDPNDNNSLPFNDVRDVVEAYISLMEKGTTGEIYNVCSGKAVALTEILEILFSLTSEKIEVEVDPDRKRKADIPLLIGNPDKIKNQIGWTPKYPLDQTLKELLDYWREMI